MMVKKRTKLLRATISLIFISNLLLADSRFSGIWYNGVQDYGQILEISDINNHSFSFTLHSIYGMNVGEIEGIAKSNNQQAIFQDTENCKIKFEFQNKKLILNTSQECNDYGGLNTNFGGDFHQKKDLFYQESMIVQ
jgi:hypothetical protein